MVCPKCGGAGGFPLPVMKPGHASWVECGVCHGEKTVPDPKKCERCKERDASPGYPLCKPCRDDDDAAIMAAYTVCG